MTDSNVPESTDSWMPSVEDLRGYIAIVDDWSKKMSALVAADSDQRSRRHLWEVVVTLWLGLETANLVADSVNVRWVTTTLGATSAEVTWRSMDRRAPAMGAEHHLRRDAIGLDDPIVYRHSVMLYGSLPDELHRLVGVRPWVDPFVIRRKDG